MQPVRQHVEEPDVAGLRGYGSMQSVSPPHTYPGQPDVHVASLASEPRMVELVVMAGESVESSKLVDDDAAVVEDAWAVGMAA